MQPLHKTALLLAAAGLAYFFFPSPASDEKNTHAESGHCSLHQLVADGVPVAYVTIDNRTLEMLEKRPEFYKSYEQIALAVVGVGKASALFILDPHKDKGLMKPREALSIFPDKIKSSTDECVELSEIFMLNAPEHSSAFNILNAWKLFDASQDIHVWKEFWTFPLHEQNLMPLETYIPFASTQSRWEAFRLNSDNTPYFLGFSYNDGTSLADTETASDTTFAVVNYLRSKYEGRAVILNLHP